MSADRIASHLEKLPLELHEPILANLSFRDVIALAKYAPDGGQVATALAISPKWGNIWPTYTAHKDEYQTLASLIMPLGPAGRLFDPTGGALDVMAGQFYRQQTRRRQMNPEYDFYTWTLLNTSNNIRDMLRMVDPVTLQYFSEKISLDHIASIAPRLADLVAHCKQEHTGSSGSSTTGNTSDEQDVRQWFSDLLKEPCPCALAVSTWPLEERAQNRKARLIQNQHHCEFNHRALPQPAWTLEQMKAFVDAYTIFQHKVNAAKGAQLKTLSKLYARHHSRLKQPLAPQTPRKNPNHIPEQLEIIVGFVMRTLDIDREAQRRSQEGVSRFRYPHACLVPYNWCLRLWTQVVEANPELLLGKKQEENVSLEGLIEGLLIGPSSSAAVPEDILQRMRIVNKGMKEFYYRDTKRGLDAGVSFKPLSYRERMRTTESRDDGKSPIFAIHETHAFEVAGRKTMLPPINSREMKWLVAFIQVVEWMEGAFPEIAAQVRYTYRKGEEIGGRAAQAYD
ncbi:hypothetical protein B0H66DRAFT_220053 [Apodospora peruviana]|uniref:F-box domain-containing protein n=1 Tax=Apodospora peruviana TaxID=516989 RepID=A0AAE0I3X8_9PEZI|nr:hypothetical protein B0H66DRAFT_220053 [Apodospora peruviana]